MDRGVSAIGGDLAEVQAVFHACLQVGRIERAGAILRRLSNVELSMVEMVYLQHQYLRAAVAQIMANPTEAAMQDLHKWFELEIRSKGIPQDVEMVAYMVKAALQSPGGQRERLVRRYMDMLDREASLELLQYAAVLTAHELNHITHIYPNYNYESSHIEEEDVDLQSVAPEASEQVHVDAERSIPGVKPTDLKGMGLKSLKASLSLFSKLPSEGIDIATASPEMRREIQGRLESDAVESAIARWREESAHLTKMGLNTSLQTKSLGGRMWKWQVALEQHLKAELVKIEEAEVPSARKSTEDQDRCIYGPFLRTIPPQRLAAVTILSTMGALGSLGVDKGMPLSTAIMAIAKSVEDESAYEALQRSRKSNIWPASKKDKTLFSREAILKATRGRRAGAVAKYANRFLDQATALPQHEWPMAMRAKVGAFLMSALVEVAQVPVTLTHPKTKETVTQMQPAFSHSFQYKMGRKLGVIVANKAIVEQLKREPVHSLLAKHLPMLVPPEPWSLFDKGGFISHPGKVMRIKAGDKDQRHYVDAAIDQGDMKIMFDGLNALGRTPWRINQPVFDIMLEAWNSGEAIANIPAENPKISIPPEPEPSTDPLERRRWIRAVKNVENAKGGLHSQRCFQNFQMEIARALRNEQFYFPHNIDFRGRAYPIPPYLNHMGADHCRGLLTFGEGRELGETGLKWLKIHLANVFGYDKASLREREEFAMKHLDSVIDSATKPLVGARWWLEAEDPWQCLAACIELNNALSSPDPSRFVSHLPVHQDGTCNGLQHYAALGGDLWGAKQVNLEPGDRPADVYTAVAELVKAQIADEKKKGDPMAIILDGKITRKTVKQTVMTNVYGVTFIGAKAQVRKQLVAAYPNLPTTDTINLGTLSSYVATRIFTALSTMFKGAHDIQHWLGDCASRISTCITREQLSRLESEWSKLSGPKDQRYVPKIEDLVQFKSSVIWTNPVHMPVVQPYRNSKAKVVPTNMQMLSLSEPHRSDPVSKRKQLQGFPPNFIHSLDATHMILSAIRCDELGLSFAAVHDSFWTHASDVGTMNRVLRDAFIQIHTDDVVGRLSAEFAARYSGCVYLRKLPHTSPAYKKIMQWRATRAEQRARLRSTPRGLLFADELKLESKRQRLLSSSNPKDIEKGKAMITAASIFEEADTSSAHSVDEGLELARLGQVSSSGEQSTECISRDANDDEARPSENMDSDEELMDADADKAKTSPEDKLSGFEKLLLPRHTKYPQITATSIWLPLTFPPVPKKGEFDVSRLKNSEYFFS
ncbi:DNA/RNA polymerase [Mollisia scopiformis]|uniref:DNA-directed RNA polymerase n=1 Tax=Mollisia scopiformis TaxID=149040 RepID=A0A194X7T9_MOLSC|nr:DNA/RNA polymerase [Mollisia scopiformis]KUJ16230.1 DNA/RNA polymerase [Mollisia scopiformis]